MIYCKKLYDTAESQDGWYALIEREWLNKPAEDHLENTPKKDNLGKQLAKDNWYPDAAPSVELCQWIGQTQIKSVADRKPLQQEKQHEFRQRYRQELIAHPEYWMPLLDKAQNTNLTLVSVSGCINNSLINHIKMLAEFLDDELDRFNDASSPVCYAHLIRLD